MCAWVNRPQLFN